MTSQNAFILGTVSAFDSTAGISLTIDGESAATTKKYKYLSSYAPVVGDRVLILKMAGTYIVIGMMLPK